jgi:hypothetical protein
MNRPGRAGFVDSCGTIGRGVGVPSFAPRDVTAGAIGYDNLNWPQFRGESSGGFRGSSQHKIATLWTHAHRDARYCTRKLTRNESATRSANTSTTSPEMWALSNRIGRSPSASESRVDKSAGVPGGRPSACASAAGSATAFTVSTARTTSRCSWVRSTSYRDSVSRLFAWSLRPIEAGR